MRVPGLRPLSIAALLLAMPPAAPAQQNDTLTAVRGLKVGHHTLKERPTGCTVILVEGGAVAGVDVRGAAPGTRETDLLDPLNTVDTIHGIALSGGSAFGLDAASGVMRWLEERGIGYPFGNARVPIVPAAILFDLRVGDALVRPGADCGYAAARAATTGPVARGSVGAGAGATVGKLLGMERAMKGGVGSAVIRMPDGLLVAALAVVNAAGDVVDPATGKVVAGIRTEDGRGLADARTLIRGGGFRREAPAGEQTTLAVVATNARLTKAQATRVAQMAHDGFARAITPVHTPVDGDTAFAIATGGLDAPADLFLIGALAAEVTADAILDAVRSAEALPGLPAARDLAR
ncbi:MAG TPA: P1 family peptidase [Methylomirabilota bacterium]